MYPWFLPLQVIKVFPSVNLTSIENNVWITAMDLQDTEKFRLYAADSEGSVYTFKVPDGHEHS
jgi:hypothetical protein